ncbi:hypothetical protein [Streptomyces sp. SID4985]|uniref:hypothetical protein n=1 Tax=Streptomyces sp. SID4985 TaxID=2690292 RepID=UPI0031BBB343
MDRARTKSSSYALSAGALLLAMVGASGCSSGEAKQDFAVPASLCGVSVPSTALSRVLPANGERVAVKQVGAKEDGSYLCEVAVDKRTVLVVTQEWITPGWSARHILIHELKIWDQKEAEGGSEVYAGGGAASLVECRGAGVEKEDVSTLVQVLKPGREDEGAMGQLIQGYTKSLGAGKPCHPRPE